MVLEIAHYKLNDDAPTTNVVDATGNYNANLDVNTEDISVAGKINSCLDFTPNQEVKTTVPIAELNAAAVYSIFAWIYPSTIAGYRPIVTQHNGFGDSAFWFGINAGNLFGGNGTALVDSGISISAGVFVHVGLVYDGVKFHFYKNAAAVEKNRDGPPDDSTALFVIASQSNGFNWYDGKIDDMRVYDFALTQANVDFLYNSGSGTEKSLADMPDPGLFLNQVVT